MTARRRFDPRDLFSRVAMGFWLPLVLLIIWWFASANSTSPFFPPLQVILTETYEQWIIGDATSTHLAVSLKNLFAGFVWGSLMGWIGGSLLARLPMVRNAANPLIYFLYVLPSPALLPAMIALFGIGDMRQIALIAFGSTWPTLLNTLDGMRGVDEVKIDTARALSLGGIRTYFSVTLRGASPQIAAGLRASLQVSIILMVVSEMVAARSGIGYFILQAQTVFATVTMWSGILVLAVVGTVLNYIFIYIERIVLRWHYRSRGISGV